jgi:hypothetical protein
MMKRMLGIIVFALMLCAAHQSHAPASVSQGDLGAQQQPDEKSRQIVLEEFTRARPAQTPSASRQRPVKTSPVRKPQYSRKTPAVAAASGPNVQRLEIGVTIWRLRPSAGHETGARVLVMENAQTTQWTPERVEADTPLRVGDRVRISIESPRSGYLYVVDREQYADGSFGEPFLIFPTLRTRGGDNEVRPGKLIDIPAQEDRPNYLTLAPTPGRNDQVAEVLNIIITPQPLEGLRITEQPLKIASSEVARWERSWSSEVERFEMEGGAGTPWSRVEKEASSLSSTRLLTQEEPTPQTIYRVASRSGNTLLVTVPLRYSR